MTPDHAARVLGVRTTAPAGDIRRARNTLAKQLKPLTDVGDKVASGKLMDVNQAFKTLMNPDIGTSATAADDHGPPPAQRTPRSSSGRSGRYEVGDRVFHTSLVGGGRLRGYGSGVVVDVVGSAPGQMVIVSFADVGTRRFESGYLGLVRE